MPIKAGHLIALRRTIIIAMQCKWNNIIHY